ncbi:MULTISPECIES: hypothetical protein [Bacillaceae]|uniref:hypothetical protein n=1 Tax=Bacillaceae TaxID=186817 RepID=UPI000B43A3B2|nr:MULTISPECIES: hypothetical protein [Bacillaceae]
MIYIIEEFHFRSLREIKVKGDTGIRFMIIGLTIILILVLFLPFTKVVERNLEVFLSSIGEKTPSSRNV